MPTVTNFSRYLTRTRPVLVANLADLATQLATLHTELAHVIVVKEQARMVAFGQGATSARALELNADMASSSANQEVIDTKGELAALQVEYDFLLFLLNNGDYKDQ